MAIIGRHTFVIKSPHYLDPVRVDSHGLVLRMKVDGFLYIDSGRDKGCRILLIQAVRESNKDKYQTTADWPDTLQLEYLKDENQSNTQLEESHSA